MGIEIVGGPANTKAKVNLSQRLATSATSRSAAKQAVLLSDSFNIISGSVSLTSAGESGILYLKNNENRDLIIEFSTIDLGPSTGGNAGAPLIKFIRNPTTGTLISNATAADIVSNQNFSSSRTLTADTFKGVEGATVTDGTDHALRFTRSDREAELELDILLEKGDSVAVTVTPETNNTAMEVLVVVRAYLLVADDV